MVVSIAPIGKASAYEDHKYGTRRLLKGCFGMPEMNFRDAIFCPGLRFRTDLTIEYAEYIINFKIKEERGQFFVS